MASYDWDPPNENDGLPSDELQREAEMHDALLAWVKMQSNDNAFRLYNAGLAYFGITPVVLD